MMNFKKTKLATAVGTAALAMGLSAPVNAVVVGGDNGWEVSFTGTINLFYNFWDAEVTTAAGLSNTAGGLPISTGAGAHTGDSSHLNEGLLPAFFTFKAKSPTVNGLTGTAQISFAPDSSNSKTSRNDKGGSAIDMREVFFNVDGSFGTISAGRTLGMYQRQAILKDQTLFGVGAMTTNDGGGTTLGRIGYGYVYPEFRTRFAYKTPTVNGFSLEVGVFDPQETAGVLTFETDTPQFQAEATYTTSFTGGSLNVWVGGIYQNMDYFSNVTTVGDDDVTSAGYDVGAELNISGFQLVGHYYGGEALGNMFKWVGGTGSGAIGVNASPGINCSFGVGCNEADNDGFYVQGGYTFNGKTKVAVSYGESNQDSDRGQGAGFANPFNEVEHDMWTVGVYHDVTPWLKVVAEYNNQQQECTTPAGANCALHELEADGFSVGGFIFW